MYCHAVDHGQCPDGFVRIAGNVDLHTASLAIAHAMWLCFLQRTLKLDAMFSFGASEQYVRTGVGEHATVYHDQIGQNKEANIVRIIGVIGLNAIGLHLIEFANRPRSFHNSCCRRGVPGSFCGSERTAS